MIINEDIKGYEDAIKLKTAGHNMKVKTIKTSNGCKQCIAARNHAVKKRAILCKKNPLATVPTQLPMLKQNKNTYHTLNFGLKYSQLFGSNSLK